MTQEMLRETEIQMKKAIEALENDLKSIRTGRASPALVERLQVEYYGTLTPLNQLATISAPEPQLLAIRPYDPGSLRDIERAILSSDLGLTPNNDGKLIRLNIPPLNEERRTELAKLVGRRAEEYKVTIRNSRRETQDELRKAEKEKSISEDDLYRALKDLQELTDRYIEEVDQVQARKEQEIKEI
jgi:ribosome recycling factor